MADAPRLVAGARVIGRGDGHLQVGFHTGHRVVVRDTDAVRRVLDALATGGRLREAGPEGAALLAELAERGLLAPPVTADLRVHLDATPVCGDVEAAFVAAGLRPAGPDAPLWVVLTRGAEPDRDRTDALMRGDVAHLFVTQHSGVTRVGPLVVPGRTACQRCLDAHAADRDPRHGLVLATHLDSVLPGDTADWLLALATAAREATALARGARPLTWSATVDLAADAPPVVRPWRRHPRCGCAWGDALTG